MGVGFHWRSHSIFIRLACLKAIVLYFVPPLVASVDMSYLLQDSTFARLFLHDLRLRGKNSSNGLIKDTLQISLC